MAYYGILPVAFCLIHSGRSRLNFALLLLPEVFPHTAGGRCFFIFHSLIPFLASPYYLMRCPFPHPPLLRERNGRTETARERALEK